MGEPGHARHPSAAASRDVLVIGGGPAGLKAAAVAAERGHRVTLWEAERWVGGQVRLAQRLPGRAEIGGAITNLEGEARRAGVRIETGVRADVATVVAAGAQCVVVATGSVPYRPPLELVGDPVVLDAWDVIRDNASVPEGHVVVADWRCDWVGLGVATLLATGGRRVTLASSGYHAGQRLQQYVRDTMLVEARRARVDLRPTLRPYGADASAVFLQDVLTSEAVVIEPASALVLAQGTGPHDELLVALQAAAAGGGFEVHGAGDVLTPRTIEEAVLEGLRVGVAV
jgi:pyruvate/2-oxoglutarate dehydrogenase complex dihydrolipoamide dehydrogenase (E3) component